MGCGGVPSFTWNVCNSMLHKPVLWISATVAISLCDMNTNWFAMTEDFHRPSCGREEGVGVQGSLPT